MRTRYLDFRAPDSTFLLNNRLRGILQAGVYLGYNAVPGTGGLNISLTMDSDPNNTGASLGKIITPDGVVIEEDADLIDAATGFVGDATDERIDYLVATYIYNAGLPNNDVTYEVIQGTAGAPPTPPVLTDDQLLLAEIRMPPLAATMLASYITDVSRKNLFAQEAINFEDVLANGVYRGYHLERGTNSNDVTLTAGVLFTKEEQRVQNVSNQVDLFTLNDTTSAAHVRWDAVVALHRAQDLEDNPAEFLLVEGTEVDESGGTSAVRPNASDILSAATAFNPEITTSDEITVLGYIRVQGIFPVSNTADYYHTPRYFPEDTALLVRGNSPLPGRDSTIGGVVPFPFTGPEGLLAALDLVESLNESFLLLVNNDDNQDERINAKDSLPRFQVLVQGEFQFGPDQRVIPPENCEVVGVGEAEFVFPPTATPNVILGGFFSGNSSCGSGPQGVPQAGAPAGFDRYEIDVSMPSELSAITDLSEFRIQDIGAATNKIFPGGAASETRDSFASGFFPSSVDSLTTSGVPFADSPLTLSVFLNDLGLPFTTTQFLLWRRNQGLKNVRIRQTGTPNQLTRGGLYCKYSMNCEIDNVSAPHVQIDSNNPGLNVGNIETNLYGWEHEGPNGLSEYPTQSGTTWGTPFGGITYDQIRINLIESGSPIEVGNSSEVGTSVGSIQLNMGGVLSQDATVAWVGATIDSIEYNGGGGLLTLQLNSCMVGSVTIEGDTAAGTLDATFQCSNCLFGSVINRIGGLGTLTFIGSNNVYMNFLDTSGTQTAALLGRRQFSWDDVVDGSEKNHNYIMTSEATFSWDSGTNIFDSDDSITIVDRNGGTQTVAAFSLSVPTAPGLIGVTFGGTILDPTANLTARVFDSAIELDELNGSNPFVIAARIGDKIYFRSGEVLDTGTSLELGTAPPPDNSVTRVKMTDSAWDFVGRFSQDFFEPSLTEDFPNELVLENTGLASLSYTAATGVVAYGSAVDLSSVQVGDTFIDSLGNRFPVLVVNDGADEITTLEGLDFLSTTVTDSWDGAIVRGNVIFKNTELVSYTYAPSTGIITYASTVDLSHVSPGYLFRDGAGVLYLISAVNDGSNTVTIQADVTDFSQVVGDSDSGSIETNNNPRNLELNDMRPVLGMEEIHLGRQLGWLDEPPTTKGKYRSQVELLYQEAFDRRFAIGRDLSVATSIQGGDTFMRRTSHFPQKGYGLPFNAITNNTQEDFIEFTAYCTGIIFGITSPDGGIDDVRWDDTTNPTGVFIDGKEVAAGSGSKFDEPIPRSFGAGGENDDHLRAKPSTIFELIQLPPGIHTVRCYILDSTFMTVPVTRMWALNDLFGSDNQVVEAPGRFWKAAKAYDHAYGLSDAIPSIGARGGRLVRYIPDSNPATKAWDQRSLGILETTGDAISSDTITNVADTTGFEVGDLVRIEGTSDTELHTIIDIPTANTFTTETALGFTESSVDIKFRGKTLLNPSPREVLNDPSEYEVDVSYSMADFIDYGGLLGSDGHGALPEPPSPTADADFGGLTAHDAIANIAGDGLTFKVSELGFTPSGLQSYFRNNFDTLDQYIRIGFVGTGLSLLYSFEAQPSSLDLEMRVDGCLVGNFTNLDSVEAGSGDQDRFTNVVSGLNYGYHTFELRVATAQAVDFRLFAFNTYRVRDPDINGTIIMSTNKLSDYAVAADIPSGLPSTLLQIDEGVIQYSPLQFFCGDGGGGGSVNIVNFTADEGRGSSAVFDPPTPCIGVFWGDVFTLRYRDDSSGSGDVEFVDNDDAFKLPSAVAGFTVTGSDTLAVVAAEDQKQTWTFDRTRLQIVKVDDGSASINIIAVEVRPPFHSPKRVLDPLYQQELHIFNNFTDLRKTSALPLRIPSVGSYELPILANLLSTETDYLFPVFLGSKDGGFYRVTFTFQIQLNGTDLATLAVFPRVGITDSLSIDGTHLAAGDEQTLAMTVLVYIPPNSSRIVAARLFKTGTNNSWAIEEGYVAWSEVARLDLNQGRLP